MIANFNTEQNNEIKSADPSKTLFALFISDLHLCVSRPHITQALLQFLEQTAVLAESLYILGDLFDYWAGDDDLDDHFHQSIIQAFNRLAQKNTQIFFMHGNRDFLIGKAFCQNSAITLLKDPSLVNIHQYKILLSHGDALCTDDIDYQNMRMQFRNANWQQNFLSQPLVSRKQQIQQIRQQSEQEKSKKSAMIMDVNPSAVTALLRAHDYPVNFIHGHTHRPARHDLLVDQHKITRWVLGDWYEQGSYLALNTQGFQNTALNFKP